jgi:hypothetical protein
LIVQSTQRTRLRPVSLTLAFAAILGRRAHQRSLWRHSQLGFAAALPDLDDSARPRIVRPGGHIPGIPADSLKLRADFDLDAQWTMGGIGMRYAIGQHASSER